MDLETQTTETKKAPTENYGSSRQVSQGTEKEKSNRKSEVSHVPVSSVHSAQERLGQGQVDPRSVIHQQVHKLPFIQDAVLKRSETSPPTRFLDNVNRLARWLLACANCSK